MRPPIAAAALAVALAVALAAPAHATEPVDAHYVARVAGFRVMTIDVSAAIGPDTYQITARARSAGLATLANRFDQTATAEGAVTPQGVRPFRFRAEGDWQGQRRRVELALAETPPRITLNPPEVPEREAVPPTLAMGGVDTLTALLTVSRRVARLGARGCDLDLTVFDGRRLKKIALTAAGEGSVPGRGTPAMRCRLEGRQLAGFWRDWDRAQAKRPQTGMVWIAPPFEGAPAMPLRIEMGIDWLGTLVVALDAAGPARLQPTASR
jgi:hypothetical protein